MSYSAYTYSSCTQSNWLCARIELASIRRQRLDNVISTGSPALRHRPQAPMHPFLRLPPSLVECAFREGAHCSPSSRALRGSSGLSRSSNPAGPATRKYSSLASTSSSSWNTRISAEQRGQTLWREKLAGPTDGRALHTSACRADHYSTLGIPRTATKAQIKVRLLFL